MCPSTQNAELTLTLGLQTREEELTLTLSLQTREEATLVDVSPQPPRDTKICEHSLKDWKGQLAKAKPSTPCTTGLGIMNHLEITYLGQLSLSVNPSGA